MSSLKTFYKNTALGHVLNLSDERGRGRGAMLLSALLTTFSSSLWGGVFYSGFLVGYNISLVNIGILSFIPYIAAPFCLLTPLLLERFQKRRFILAFGRALYYTVNILGLTLLPRFVADPQGRVVGFCVIIFISNAINNIFASGYTVWHLNFLPDEVRTDYFNVSAMLTCMLGGIVMLAGSVVTDALPQGEAQLQIIITLRYIAYAFALADVAVLSLPKEYPYPKDKSAVSLGKMMTLPFKSRKFMATILVLVLYSVINGLSLPFINVHLIENLHISYTVINAIYALYFLFYIIFGASCKRQIGRWSGFKTFALWVLIQVPSYVIYAFVQPGDVIAFIIVRLMQHVCGIYIGLTTSNFPYVNLPPENRTVYLSFYSLLSSAVSLLGVVSGTWFIGKMGDSYLSVLGTRMNGVQLLLLATAGGFTVLGTVVLCVYKKLLPDGWEPQPDCESPHRLRAAARRIFSKR